MMQIAPPAVRERPMLYQGAMIRALLADTKTMTRRTVKPQPAGEWAAPGRSACPYGIPGDQLWVRETFFAFGRWETRFSAKKGRDEWHFIDITLETDHSYVYAADGGEPALIGERRSTITPAWWKRPAIFMPRAASRIQLEISEVRVERLQAISQADAIAEGIEAMRCSDCHLAAYGLPGWGHDELNPTPQGAYRFLWESINGAGSWDANPYVWAVSFRRLKP